MVTANNAHDPITQKVLSALSEIHCPVCSLAYEDSQRYLATLLDEFVNDVGVRTRFREHGGFCSFHSWSMKQMGNPLAHAILYVDLLNRPSAKRNPKGLCMVCQHTQERRRVYLDEVAAIIGSDETRAHYAQRSFLCMEHYDAVRDKLKPPKLVIVDTLRAELTEGLKRQLGAFMQSYDYRFTEQRVESDIWIRAIEFLKGSEENSYGVKRRLAPRLPIKVKPNQDTNPGEAAT